MENFIFILFIFGYGFLFKNDKIVNFNFISTLLILSLIAFLNHLFFIGVEGKLKKGKDLIKTSIITFVSVMIGLKFGILYTLLILIISILLKGFKDVKKINFLITNIVIPLFEKGKYRECIKELEEVNRISPNSDYVFYLLSKCNSSVLNLKESKKWLDMIDIKKSKLNKEMILVMKIELMFFLGDIDHIEEIFNEISNPLFKNEALAFIILTNVKNKKFEEALLKLEQWENYTKDEENINKEVQKLNVKYNIDKFRRNSLLIKSIYNFYIDKLDVTKEICEEIIEKTKIEDEYFLISKYYLEKGEFPIL